MEEVWRPKKQAKLNSGAKTTSKYFAGADVEKVTPKVSRKL